MNNYFPVYGDGGRWNDNGDMIELSPGRRRLPKENQMRRHDLARRHVVTIDVIPRCRAVVTTEDNLGVALSNRATRGPSWFSPPPHDNYLCRLYNSIFFTNILITDRSRVNSSMGYRLAYVNTPVFTLCRPRELRANLVVGAVSPNHR